MENLLQFFKRFGLFLQFLLLEAVAIILLIYFNGYQRSVFMSSAGLLTGAVYQSIDAVTGYFYLREANEQLSCENAQLKNEIARMQAQLQPSTMVADSLACHLGDSIVWQPYHYMAARVIQNSINKQQNYITLDKGSDDGIFSDMGVVSSQGVVGIVKSVSIHYAMVMPIVNVQSRISCRLDSSQNFGSLVWDAVDYRYATLQEVPGHVEVTVGETVSTSGFSSIFPAGIPVGKVVDVQLMEENQFLNIKVELSVDFGKINQVNIIGFNAANEITSLR